MTTITGNTYPVKDAIKALGGRWNADKKAWMVPDEKADQAKAIVAGAGKPSRPTDGTSYKPTVCSACGRKAEWEHGRGGKLYATVKILRSGECVDCYEERRMGY